MTYEHGLLIGFCIGGIMGFIISVVVEYGGRK